MRMFFAVLVHINLSFSLIDFIICFLLCFFITLVAPVYSIVFIFYPILLFNGLFTLFVFYDKIFALR